MLMKFLFQNQQTYANFLLRLMLANYTPTGCVNLCRPVLVHDGFKIPRREFSYFDKTRPVDLKRWSCPIFNKQDPNLKLKSSTLQADIRNFTVSVLMNFVRNAILSWKPRFASTTFDPFKKGVHPSLKRISNVAVKNESSMYWDNTIYYNTISLEFENANGGGFTKHPTLLNNISETTFLTGVHLHLRDF